MNTLSWIIGTLVLWVLTFVGTIPLARLFARWGTSTSDPQVEDEDVQAAESAGEPDPAPEYLQHAYALVEAQQLEAALKECERVIERHPESAEALNLMGTVLDDLGRSAQAIGSYRRALAIDPTFADAQENLREALSEQKGRTRSPQQIPTGYYILADVLVMGIGGLLLGFFTGSYFIGISWRARNWPGMLVFIGASFLGSLLHS